MGDSSKKPSRWLVVVKQGESERRRYYDHHADAATAAERIRKRQPDAIVKVQRGAILTRTRSS